MEDIIRGEERRRGEREAEEQRENMSLVTRKHIRSDEGEGGIGPGEGTVARYIMEINTKAHEAMGTTGQN